MPEGVESLPEKVFKSCNKLRNVVLPSTLSIIGANAFEGCNGLPGIIIPDGVKEIGDYAFYNCNGLVSIELPDSVCKLSRGTFAGNSNLANVYTTEKLISIGDEVVTNKNVCMYVVENSYAATYCIDHDIKFEYITYREADYSNYVLDMSRSKFYTNTDKARLNNCLSLYLDYCIKEEYQNALNNKKIYVRFSSNTRIIDNSITVDGSTCTDYEYENNLLMIPIKQDEGKIRISIKPTFSGALSAYAYLSYEKGGKTENNIINTLNINNPVITLEVQSPISSSNLEISGVTEALKKIDIYIDDIFVAESTSRKNGDYSAKIKIENPVDKQKYSIKAVLKEDKSVSATATVLYKESTPVLKKFDMYYMAHEPCKMDLLSVMGLQQSVSFAPGHTFTFDIKFDNASSINKVYVNSMKNGTIKRIPAIPSANEGEYIATGYFDKTDKNYVPGTISLWYSTDYDGSKLSDSINLKNEELPDFYQDATVDAVEENGVDAKLNITLKDGTVVPVEFKTYTSLSEAREDLLGKNQYKQQVQKAYGINTLSDGPGLEDVNYLIDELKKEYGDNVKADAKDKLNENGVLVIQDGNDLIYILWDSAKKTVRKAWFQGGLAGLIMEETCYTTSLPEAWEYAGKYISLGKEAYKCFEGAININDARRDIRSSETLSDAEKKYALEKIDQTSYVYAALFAFRIVMSVAKPAITTAVTTTFGPITGLLVSLAIDEGEELVQKYLDGSLEYYAAGGQGSYLKWLIDPSGYVYEGVTNNRIEGAKVTAYYKETMDSTPTIWNASEYGQQNPLYSDSAGCYAWDTPEGYWQIKVEKEGYENWVSEWLTVPPMQTEVNAALISKEIPKVEWINVQKDSVQIKFSKYMNSETIKNIVLKDSQGKQLAYELEYRTDEMDKEGNIYAETYNLKTSTQFKVGTKYSVLTSPLLKSYAGVSCEKDEYSGTCTEDYRLSVVDSVEVDYGSRITVPVRANLQNGDKSLQAISEFPELAKVVSVQKSDDLEIWNLTIEGRMPGQTNIKVKILDTDIETTITAEIKMNNTFSGFPEEHEHLWDTGKVIKKATCTTAGTIRYNCTKCDEMKEEIILATGHEFEGWKTSSKATVFKAEIQKRKCKKCGIAESRTTGCALKPIIKMNMSSVILRTNQSVTGLKVTQMAFGDSIKSWKSSNTKIVKVSNTGKLTAQKKTGKAYVIITLKSGISSKISVKVQKTTVKTTSITGLNKKVTLKKGKKYTLKPVIIPFSSQEKVTYTSSNKKIVTVSSKGVIQGKKPGKAIITVKSGKKKVKITVKVTK